MPDISPKATARHSCRMRSNCPGVTTLCVVVRPESREVSGWTLKWPEGASPAKHIGLCSGPPARARKARPSQQTLATHYNLCGRNSQRFTCRPARPIPIRSTLVWSIRAKPCWLSLQSRTLTSPEPARHGCLLRALGIELLPGMSTAGEHSLFFSPDHRSRQRQAYFPHGPSWLRKCRMDLQSAGRVQRAERKNPGFHPESQCVRIAGGVRAGRPSPGSKWPIRLVLPRAEIDQQSYPSLKMNSTNDMVRCRPRFWNR